MNIWEYLDRRGERRAQTVRKPMDTRVLVGALFFLGYYVLVAILMTRSVPGDNAPLVRDALLVLGPPVGAIVNALFRTDARDEQAALNTGAAFQAATRSSEAIIATVGGTTTAGNAAEQVSDAAAEKAREIKGTDNA